MLQINRVRKYFIYGEKLLSSKGKGLLKAVDDVDLMIRKGEIVGLVGESGCGKTTLGRLILKLTEPTAGRMIYNSTDYTDFSREEMLPLRRKMQLIFQDPYSSLNPRMRLGAAIGEPLIVHGIGEKRKVVRDKVLALLETVGLSPDFYDRYPHEMSGGQRQRAVVARTLAVDPQFIIADEPVSALDVSVQAQILNMLKELQEKLDLTYLFIAHDLGVARYMSSRIAVMYLGKIVEIGGAEELFTEPLHPYTTALVSSIPRLWPESDTRKKGSVLVGEVPTPLNLPAGCRFHPRCLQKLNICSVEEPVLREVTNNYQVACHRCS